MTQEELKENMATLKENVLEYYSGDDEYFDEAFDGVMKTAPSKRMTVPHTCDIEKKDLFCNIDNVIEYLKSLKSQGYVEIEEKWSGYEDNYFVAIKYEEETDNEYYRRLGELTSDYSEDIADREEEKKRKNKRIKELEEELRKLKS